MLSDIEFYVNIFHIFFLKRILSRWNESCKSGSCWDNLVTNWTRIFLGPWYLLISQVSTLSASPDLYSPIYNLLASSLNPKVIEMNKSPRWRSFVADDDAPHAAISASKQFKIVRLPTLERKTLGRALTIWIRYFIDDVDKCWLSLDSLCFFSRWIPDWRTQKPLKMESLTVWFCLLVTWTS